MPSQVQPGNKVLFFVVKLFAVIYGIGGIVLIGLGIWFWQSLQKFTILQIVIIGLGTFEVLLVLFAWTARTSTIRLRIYVVLLSILFVIKLATIIIVFVIGPGVIKQITQQDNQQVQALQNKLFAVNCYCIGVLVVMLCQIIFVSCYINSIKNRNLEYDYKFMDQDGNKITMQEKGRRDFQNISQKYDQKRQELYMKYPKFKEYKDSSANGGSLLE